MPRKKAPTYEDKRKRVIAKLIFAGVVFVLVLMTNFFVMRNRPVEPSGEPTSTNESLKNSESEADAEGTADVLGESIENIQNRASEVAHELEGAAEGALETGKEHAEKTVSTVIYETTLKPIIEKIQGLPDEQKEFIQEAVCR